MAVRKLICSLLLIYLLSNVSGSRRVNDGSSDDQGGDADDDTGRSGQRLRDANRQRDDVRAALNTSQQAAVDNYRTRQEQVDQSLNEYQQELLENVTQVLENTLATLTSDQRQIYDNDGVDNLATSGVIDTTIQAIRKAVQARDAFIGGLTTQQQRAVRLADEARRNANRAVGQNNLQRLNKARENRDKAFKALEVKGISERRKVLAGYAELAMDRFLCKNLTRIQRKLYNYAVHVRKSFDRELSEKMQKKLKNTERALREALEKLTLDQRKTYDSRGIEGLRGDLTIDNAVMSKLRHDSDLMDQIKANLSTEKKERYAECKEAMRNFTESLAMKQQEMFKQLKNRLREVYSNMTKLQARTLNMKLQSIMDSPCQKEDKQGGLDRFTDWLQVASLEEKTKSLNRLKHKLQDLDNQLKTVERMIQLNARQLKIGIPSKSRCMLYHDTNRGHLSVVSFEGDKVGMLYSTDTVSVGDIRWRQITDKDRVKDVVEKVKDKFEDENVVTLTTGQTWRVSRGKIELQRVPKGPFRTVGLCNCDGCDVITPQ